MSIFFLPMGTLSITLRTYLNYKRNTVILSVMNKTSTCISIQIMHWIF